MMDCSETRKKLSEALDTALPAAEERLVEEHLASCESCRAYFEELKRGRILLGTLDSIEPPPWLTQKIMAHVQEEMEERRHGLLSWFFRPLKTKIPVQALALILVVGLAVLLYRANAPVYERIEAPKSTESTATEQPAGLPDTVPPDRARAGATRKTERPPLREKETTAPPPEAKNRASALPEQTVAPFTAQDEARPHSPAAVAEERIDRGAFDHSVLPPAKNKGIFVEQAAPEPDGSGRSKDGRSVLSSTPALRKSAPAFHRLSLAVKAQNVEATAELIEGLLSRTGAANLSRTSRPDGYVITAVVTSDKLSGFLAEMKDRFGTDTPPITAAEGAPVALTIEITTP